MKTLGRATLLYAGLALLATWPLAIHLGTHVPGASYWGTTPSYDEVDANLWNLWWFRHAIVDLHQSPFACPILFHPWGANLWLHTLAPLHGLVALLLQIALSLTAAQNVLVLLNLVAAGLAAWALARHLGATDAGALLAGAIFAFSPPALGHLRAAHYEIIATAWLPLSLLLFLRIVEKPRLREGILLGAVLAASAYAVQYYFLYSIELLLVAALVSARRLLRREVLIALAAGAGTALLGLLPLLIAFLRANSGASRVPGDFDFLSGDLLSFVVPSFAHPLLAGFFAPFYERFNPGETKLPQETTMFLGWTALALAVFGLVLSRRERKPVALVAAIFAVFVTLSLGSQLKVNGVGTGVPLPSALLAHVPVLSQARAPGRHVILVVLALAVLAGAGFERIRRPWLRALLALLVAFEYASLPFPLIATEVGPAYHRLAQVPGDYAVLELPLQVRDGHVFIGRPNPTQMLGQTVHGHAILGGMVSRLPDETLERILTAPVVSTLLHPRGAKREAMERDMQEGGRWLEENRIFAVLVHAEMVRSPQHLYLERIAPVVSRETIADGSLLLWLRDPATLARGQ